MKAIPAPLIVHALQMIARNVLIFVNHLLIGVMLKATPNSKMLCLGRQRHQTEPSRLRAKRGLVFSRILGEAHKTSSSQTSSIILSHSGSRPLHLCHDDDVCGVSVASAPDEARSWGHRESATRRLAGA